MALVFKIIFLLLICKVSGQLIISGPEDVTAKVHSKTSFSCHVKFEITSDISWEFNNKMLYWYQDGGETYHTNKREKYEVERTEHNTKFNLNIYNLNFDDGGLYTCKLGEGNKQETAALVVLDQPNIVSPRPGEETGTYVQCNVRFGAPKKGQLAENHYPQVELALVYGSSYNMDFRVKHLETGESEVLEPNDTIPYYTMTQSYRGSPAHTSVWLPRCIVTTHQPHFTLTTNMDHSKKKFEQSWSLYQLGYPVTVVCTCGVCLFCLKIRNLWKHRSEYHQI